jgi:hypothetical protein
MSSPISLRTTVDGAASRQRPLRLQEVWKRQGPEPGPRADAGTVALGLWLVAGVFIDGWAHFHSPQLESFLTPWHAVLYSGAASTFAFFAWLTWRARAVPAGYRAGLVAAPLFLLGGALDSAWHKIFGIEVGLDALLSPTHLVLFASGLLVLSTPWRSGYGNPTRWLQVASLLLTTLLVAFFAIYTSALTEPYAVQSLTTIPEGAPGHREAEMPAVAGLATYLLTTLLLVVPVVLLARRGRAPQGAVTALCVLVVAASGALVEFAQPWLPVVAAAAGACADALLQRRQTHRNGSGRAGTAPVVLAVSALTVVLWSGQMALLAAEGQLRWPAELIAGAVILCAALAAATATLAERDPGPRTDAHAQARGR